MARILPTGGRKSHSMKLISPAEIEIKYSRWEKKVYSFLSLKTNSLYLFFSAVVVVCLSYHVTKQITSNYGLQFAEFRYVLIISDGISSIILLSLFSFLIRTEHQAFFQLASLSIVSAVSSYFFGLKFANTPLFWSTILVLPTLSLLGWFYLKMTSLTSFKSSKVFYVSTYTLLHWFITLAYSYYLFYSEERRLLVRFWGLHGIYIWMTILLFSFRQKNSSQEFFIALNPMNGLRGVLWPDSSSWAGDSSSEKKYIWWRGLCNIALGYMLLWVSLYLKAITKNFNNSFFSAYLTYVFVDIAALNILTGGLRLFGYRVIDGTKFVLLSRTPAQWWQRGSVYNYLLVRNYIYLPLLRMIKNNFLATFTAFLFFFTNHWGITGMIRIFFENSSRDYIKHLQLLNSLHFIFLFILLYVSRRFWVLPWQSAEPPWRAWLSVGLTHFLHWFIVYIVYYKIPLIL